ncbi:hypothetical protein J6590_059659 [Homalodisca vitripennis]|nr:hypothetical protein J6590_059659 [Homalodisca vitripennis]
MIAKTEAVNIERVENNIHLARKRKTKWISQDTKIREAQAEVASTPPTKTVYDFRSMLAYKYPNMNHLNLCEDEEDLVNLESEMLAHLIVFLKLCKRITARMVAKEANNHIIQRRQGL